MTYPYGLHKPYAWVAKRERDSKKSTSGQECHIPPRRVVEVKSLGARSHVVLTEALSQDDEIVPVKMNQMGGGNETVYFVWEE